MGGRNSLSVRIENCLVKNGIPFFRSGNNIMFSCPFHLDRNPSCGISLDSGIWHCFSCERSGSFSQFLKILGESETFSDRVAGLFSNKEEEEKTLQTLRDFKPYFSEDDVPQVVKERISFASISKFKVGEARMSLPGYFVIPIEMDGKFFGFACRNFFKNAKIRWLFTKGFKKVLFPFEGSRERRKEIIITEGLIPAIRLHEWGFNGAACFGHSLNEFQIQQLVGFSKVYISFDSYEDHFLSSIIRVYKQIEKFVEVFVLKTPRDIDEMSLEEFQREAKIFRLPHSFEIENKKFLESVSSIMGR